MFKDGESFFLKFFLNSINLLHENVTGKDFFLNTHIWTNDQYSRPTSIKNGQLTVEGNRHGLGWGFLWVLPQGHVKVISRSNQTKRARIFSFCCFCFNCNNLGCLLWLKPT